MAFDFPFTHDEIEQLCTKKIPNWTHQNGRLTLAISCAHFGEAMTLANQIYQLAEIQQHHPILHISYTKLTIELYTHDQNAITPKDFVLAEEIDILLKK